MARYKLVSEKDAWRLSPGANLIGRFSHCTVRIDGAEVAGEHARVDVQGDRVLLTDLGSDAGTLVGDERVESAAPLEPGATFRVGEVTFRLTRSRDLLQMIRSPVARRVTRIATKVAIGLVAAFVILLVALPLIYDAESFKRDAIEAIEAALSRDAEIGDVEFELFRGQTVLSDVVVHNLPEFGGEPLVKVPKVQVHFETGAYLGSLGRSLHAEVTVERPVLMLERSDRGRWNVGDLLDAVLGAVREAREEFAWWAPYSELSLRVRVSDATLRIRDDFAGETREITGITFEADLPSLDGEFTYRLAGDVPVGGRPGKVEAKGRLTLFKGGGLSAASVKGEVFSLNVRGLDLRAVPGLPRGASGPFAKALPVDEVDLEIDVTAESLGSCRARVEARFWGARTEGGPKVTLSADLAGSVLPLALERGEVTARGPSWDLAAQGRVVPAKRDANDPEGAPPGGAEALDVDATFHADVGLLDEVRRRIPIFEDSPFPPLAGRLVLKLSTTGSTRELDVIADARFEGLSCLGTGALPEDVSISLRGTAGLIGWTTLDSIHVKSFVAGASFLHASVAPGEVRSIARPEGSSGRIGPVEFDVDLAELGHRYGPLFAFRPLDCRVHGWAELSGKDGRLVLRHAAYSRAGATTEGTTAVVFPAEGRARAEVEWRFSEPAGLAARLRGRTELAGDEPEFDISLSASGALSRVLEVAKPYLGATGSVWARGRFRLDDVRVSGTPSRFGTNGRLELLEPELWGGDPTAPPFSESRFNAIWNLDFEMPGPSSEPGPIRLRANLLKGSSSTLRFSLEGDVEDLGRGLGRYELRAFADLDRIGAVLRKLALIPVGAAVRGTANVELSADTRKGHVRLTKLELDTPFIEAEGGGEINRLPVALLMGRAPGGGAVPAPETVSGKLHLAAKVDVGELGRLAEAFWPSKRTGLDSDGADPAPPVAEAEGEVRLDFTAEGSGAELLVSGEINLDDFVGRLGRHVRKAAGELASLRVSASLAPGGADVVTLHSGVLTLGGAGRPASFEVSGRLARGLDRFVLAAKSDRFDVSPVAALFPGVVKEATGAGRLDIRSEGRLLRGVLVPGTLKLEGSLGLSGVELRLPGSPELLVRADGKLVLGGRKMSAAGLKLATRIRSLGGLGAFDDFGSLSFKKLDLALRAAPPGVSVVFDAHSHELDVAALFAAASHGDMATGGDGSTDGSAVPGWLSLGGGLAVDRANLWPGRAVAEELVCRIELDGGSLRLKDVVARIWGGLMSGDATMDLTGARCRVKGALALDEVELVEAAKAAGIPGALEGMGGLSMVFEGEGLGRRDFARSWRLDVRGRTSEVALATARWPLAREVRIALERVVGIAPQRDAKAHSKPVVIKVAVRRGRTTMESTDFEFGDGLRLGVSGRTELDGRIAAWVTVRRLPNGAAGLPEDRRAIVRELVRRGTLRFAVTGTWARPVVDVEGLLRWILPIARDGETADDDPAGEVDAGTPEP
jgi:hypothetical protein